MENENFSERPVSVFRNSPDDSYAFYSDPYVPRLRSRAEGCDRLGNPDRVYSSPLAATFWHNTLDGDAAMKIIHPLTSRMAPIQHVLRDLASQENCDGDPYDQMYQAAAYIDDLETRLQFLREKYNPLTGEVCV